MLNITLSRMNTMPNNEYTYNENICKVLVYFKIINIIASHKVS